jgi:hypothetical protein
MVMFFTVAVSTKNNTFFYLVIVNELMLCLLLLGQAVLGCQAVLL